MPRALPPPSESEAAAAQHLFTAGRAVRETVDPFAPVLVWHTDAGETGITALDGSSGIGVARAADAALTGLPDATGSGTLWFALLIDAYGRLSGDGDPTRADQLADLFLLGDPTVVEQLIALVAHRGAVRMWRQVYRHTPVDGWEWDDLQWMEQPVLPDDGLMRVLQRHAAGNP